MILCLSLSHCGGFEYSDHDVLAGEDGIVYCGYTTEEQLTFISEKSLRIKFDIWLDRLASVLFFVTAIYIFLGDGSLSLMRASRLLLIILFGLW